MTRHLCQIQRMAILADIKSLLSRPIQADPAPAKGKRPSDAERPVTEAELAAALERMTTERLQAYATISEAGDRREALLMQDGSDAEIIELGRQVDAASLLLERLDRLEPAAQNRLMEMRDAHRATRWLKLRDDYLAIARKHLDDLRQTRLDQEQYHSAVAKVVAEFPDAGTVLPRFPFLDDGLLFDFERELSRFAGIAFNPRPGHPRPMSLGDRMQQAGFDAERESHVWGTGAVLGAVETVSIKLKAARQASDGTWLKIGDTTEVTGAEAARMVAAGQATLGHEEHF